MRPAAPAPTSLVTSPQMLMAALAQRAAARNTRLGDLLVAAGVVSTEAVGAALIAQNAGNKARLGDILVAMGAVEPDDIARVLDEQCGPLLVDVAAYPLSEDAIGRLPANTANKMRVLPFDLLDGTLYVAASASLTTDELKVLRFASGCPQVVSLQAANIDLLGRLIARHYVRVDAMQLRGGGRYDESDQDIHSAAGQFRRILATALSRHASDVHIRPQPDGTRRVFLRIDGNLMELPSLDAQTAMSLTRHLEAVAGMGMRRQNEAKDGRLALTLDGSPVDIRVSLMPGASGASIVLRVLDPGRFPSSISHLRLEQLQERALRALITRPHGLFLVTGPTGSGKTTTLYTLIKQLNTERHVHVATAEDPVEFRLPGINQFDTSDFAETLKQLLRHDPDVIMVGELRDSAAVTTAVNAAMTGHLVLSTVHANDSVSAIHRLLGLGVPPVLIGSSLSGVMSQRLVRLRCTVCRGAGCENCHKTGYAGRRLIAEILRPRAAFAEELTGASSYADIVGLTEFVGGFRMDDMLLKMAERGETDWDEVAQLISNPARMPKKIAEMLGFANS